MTHFSFFIDDNDYEVFAKQTAVQSHALYAIVNTCNQLARFARRLLSDENYPEWGKAESFEIDTLITVHDILAAVWRFKNDLRQYEFNFDRMPKPTPEQLWLKWLREQVNEWVWQPELVRYIQQILCNQHTPVGYLAEARLCLSLLEAYTGIPWTKTFRRRRLKPLFDMVDGGAYEEWMYGQMLLY